MKKEFTFLFLTLSFCYCFSQDCEETNIAVLNGEIYEYELEDCITEVSINTSADDTVLHGITLIDAMESINIKPTGNKKISIKPDDPIDFISLRITDEFISKLAFIDNSVDNVQAGVDRRTASGNTTTSLKDLDYIQIYPNPVDSILTIESEETISYYKIVTEYYGTTVKEGTLPSSNQLDVSALKAGPYYLLLQTESEIIMTRLIKN